MMLRLTVALCVLSAVAQAVLFKFPVGSSNPSIMIEAEFEIKIDASQNGKKVGTFALDTSDAGEVEIQGFSNRRSFIYLRFTSGVSWAFVFTETTTTDITMTTSVQFKPVHIFKFTTMDMVVQYEDPKEVKMPPSGKSFNCDHKTEKQYLPVNIIPGDTNFTVTVIAQRFKVQAYGVKEGKFGPSVHCEGDSGSPTLPTTTTTTTTPTTTTTTTPGTTHTTTTTTTTTTEAPYVPPTATTNTYIVKDNSNMSCIVMIGKVNMDITYEAKVEGHPNQNLTLSLGIPADATADGDCSSRSYQRLSISFLGNWILDIVFRIHGSSLLRAIEAGDQKGIDYSIHNMSLTYYMDDHKFPNAVQANGTKLMVSNTDEKNLPEKKEGSNYYQCDSGSDYHLDNAKVKTSDLKFKAFNDNDDSSFQGKPMRCDADNHSHHSHTDWPLILGSVLGFLFLLLLIILLIYIIARWRASTYQSI